MGARDRHGDKRTLDQEREYLEGLLNTRFNFHLILLSALGAGLLGEDHLDTDRARILLALGTFASLAMTLIILRTAGLLQVVLDMIVGKRDAGGDRVRPGRVRRADHPYRIASHRIRFPRINANRIIEAVVVLATLGLLAATVQSWRGADWPALGPGSERPAGAPA